MGTVNLLFRAKAPDAKNPDGGYVPVSPADGLPVVLGAAVTLARVGEAAGKYELAPASATTVLGGAGAVGDYLAGLQVIPTTVSPGPITILDGAAAIVVFAGGANSLSNLLPFRIPIGAYSVSGPWSITNGAGLSCLATGNFT